MSQEKYIGMDVHEATISVAVRDVQGKLIMESLLETNATTILEFVQGLRGTLALTFEEGTSAAWLHVRETNLHSGLGRTFFLTSLFIELKTAVRDFERYRLP